MKILFIPWFRANSKNINKYINMYKYIYGNSTNVDVVNYNLKDAVSFKSWNEKFQKGYLDKNIKNYNYDCIHMVSGGSLIPYSIKKEFKYKCSIFDSGPFQPRADLTAKYICNEANIKHSNLLETVINYKWLLYDKTDYKNVTIDFNKYLRESHTNNLCILAKNDNYVDLSEIKKFILDTKGEIKYIDNSKHAELLRYNEEEMIEYIKEHINKFN